jgi:hypothetical protein
MNLGGEIFEVAQVTYARFDSIASTFLHGCRAKFHAPRSINGIQARPWKCITVYVLKYTSFKVVFLQSRK